MEDDIFLFIEQGRWDDALSLVTNPSFDIDKRSADGLPLLDLCILYRNETIMEILLDRGINTEKRCRFGGTALMTASHLCDLRIVRLLLHRGAEINAIDLDGENALFYAIESDGDNSERLAMIELLVDAGIDVLIENKRGESILQRIRTHHPSDVSIMSTLDNAVRLYLLKKGRSISSDHIHTVVRHAINSREGLIDDLFVELLPFF